MTKNIATQYKDNVDTGEIPAELAGVNLETFAEASDLGQHAIVEDLHGDAAADAFMGFKKDGTIIKPSGLSPEGDAEFDVVFGGKEYEFDEQGSAVLVPAKVKP